MSTKLSTDTRARICKALLTGKFKQREDLQAARELAIASAIYDMKYTPAEQEKLKAAPHHWLPKMKTLKARIFGDDVEFHLSVEQPVPYEHRYHDKTSQCLIVVTDVNTVVGGLYKVYSEEKAAISREKDKLGREIRGVLNSVSTDRKLCTVWPEVRLVVEAVMGRPSESLLPVVQVRDLNASLGFKAAK